MLTYQLQKRVCVIKNEKELKFPNDVEIEVCLEPAEQTMSSLESGFRILRFTFS